jgi:hypothetical protein
MGAGGGGRSSRQISFKASSNGTAPTQRLEGQADLALSISLLRPD